jgi:hypothetical protein
MSSRYCRHCDRHVQPEGPSRLAAVGLVAAALGGVVAVLGASLIGPFVMFVIPFMALYGFSLGPLHALASAPHTCPSCRREVIFRTREEARASARVVRIAAPVAPLSRQAA